MKVSLRKNQGCTVAITALSLLLSSAEGWRASAAATLVEIFPNHGSTAFGLSISDSGRAAGYSIGGTPAYAAFRSAVEGGNDFDGPSCVHHAINSLISGGVTVSDAFDIYQSGSNPLRVVGDCIPTGTHWRGYLYYEDLNASAKAAVLLTEPVNCMQSSAQAVVAATGTQSHVVGYAESNGRYYAYYWLVDTNGSIQWENLGSTYFSSSTNSYALDSDGSRKVGYRNSGSDSSNLGFIISGTNSYTLNVIGSTATAALGMNADTLIVGYYVQSGYTKPVFWRNTAAGKYPATTLSTSTYTYGAARGVNADGVIVGSVWNTAYPTTGYDERACYWSTNGTMTTFTYGTYELIRTYQVASTPAKHVAGFGVLGGGYRNGFILYNW